jgi:DNA-binding NtrC family response regulator
MYKILIVDDEENLRLLYETEFKKQGYETCMAGDGKSAIKQVKEAKPDLVLLDIKMPGVDGLELLNKILNINNKLPVILNTAYASFKDNFNAWSADAYVVKSSDLTELKDTVKRIIDERYGDN